MNSKSVIQNLFKIHGPSETVALGLREKGALKMQDLIMTEAVPYLYDLEIFQSYKQPTVVFGPF